MGEAFGLSKIECSRKTSFEFVCNVTKRESLAAFAFDLSPFQFAETCEYERGKSPGMAI
jgi:hypothetical protein